MLKFIKATMLLVVASLAVKAQTCSNFLGTKTLYRPGTNATTSSPYGYHPVFINHVGRHGARHLTKAVNTYFAFQLLMKADSLHELTAAGKKLKQMVADLDKVEANDVKSISIEGKEELEGIGKRMAKDYPGVFSSPAHVNVATTKEVRTGQSATAFLEGLKKQLKDSPELKAYNDDTNLRFYDLSPVYKAFKDSGPWQSAMEKLEKEVHLAQVNEDFTKSIFTPAFVKNIKAEDQDKFTSDIFGFTTIVNSLEGEIKKAGFTMKGLDFKSFYTCEQIIALSKIDVADDYLKKGPGLDNNGIQVRIAVPLLVNFINTTDDFIKEGKVNAQLRFAHAETIAPFAALLDITSASTVSRNIGMLSESWQSGKVAPLSANIQWVLYKKQGSADYLVKILLNEKDARISGTKSSLYPYYHWKDLRAFYMNKLNKMKVGLNDDMTAYLTNIR